MQRMNKKADIEFETILKLLLALIVLFLIIFLIFLFKGKSFTAIEKIKELLRFGP